MGINEEHQRAETRPMDGEHQTRDETPENLGKPLECDQSNGTSSTSPEQPHAVSIEKSDMSINEEDDSVNAIEPKQQSQESKTDHAAEDHSSSSSSGDRNVVRKASHVTWSDWETGGNEDAVSDCESVTGHEDSERGNKGDSEDTLAIAKDEGVAVNMLKVVLYVVFFVMMALVASFSFQYLRLREKEDFESTASANSHLVLDSIGETIGTSLGAIDAFIASIVSCANSSNQQWPLVTIPDHAVRLSKVRGISRATVIQQYQLVRETQRQEWEEYAIENDEWIHVALETQENDPLVHGNKNESFPITSEEHIYYGEDREPSPPGQLRYAPTWQSYPIGSRQLTYNWNAIAHPMLAPGIRKAIVDREAVISRVINFYDSPDDKDSIRQTNEWISGYTSSEGDTMEPFYQLLYPVISTSYEQSAQDEASPVAVIAMTVAWSDMFRRILPSKNGGLHVVVKNSCDQAFTYIVDGADANYIGEGDLHNSKFDDHELIAAVDGLQGLASYSSVPLSRGICEYSFHVYPTEEMEATFFTSAAVIMAVSVIAFYLVVSVAFWYYDAKVMRRQNKAITLAKQSGAIVMSIFPASIRSRLFNDQAEEDGDERPQATRAMLKSFLNESRHGKSIKMKNSALGPDAMVSGSRPIADLFPETTVLFADIATFTAWSSTRDPTQVFTLLETIYGAFDDLAFKRGVFKVETIGDSYVAVAGLPEAREDHAEVMVKFAADCRDKFSELSRQLEVILGPDTGELAMRFGLHSGPTTAGVLRGQKSRFQLFGDTVNTASRMESTGKKQQIHVTQATANLLIKAKKGHWLKSREETVEVKGKGQMQTYFAEPKSTMLASPIDRVDLPVEDKTERLVGWVTDVMGRLLVQLKEHRQVAPGSSRNSKISEEIQIMIDEDPTAWQSKKKRRKSGRFSSFIRYGDDAMVLEEVKEIIELPDFDATKSIAPSEFNTSDLDKEVYDQLKEYVSTIASMYNENPFHNFMHASHVCMSVAKLMGRIVSRDRVLESESEGTYISLHDHTYGIISDPLTQFACVFAALIHDVDHPGIPNPQMVKERWPLAKKYQEKSIAEQNSVDISWSIFLDPRYENLRDAIYQTERERRRFRQLVVNSVMATDIMDKDLKALRNERWDTAFANSESQELFSELDNRNRKATIVIEHLIQASDIAHTMQHWHVYRKWNERLFQEMSLAYRKGRAEKDPADFWYEGELGFFDFYIIPLTKKLRECGVFGVSSDELLSYAVKNREEWERRGKDIVAQMVQGLKSEQEKEADDDSGSMRGEMRIQERPN